MMKDNESVEMYLETILILKKEKNFVRSIDVVERMEFAKSSVSVAVKKMVSSGLILIDDKGGIELTELGRTKAENVYEKHCTITKMLEMLGVDSKSAEDNACRIEHVISEDVFQAMKDHLNEFKNK